MSQFSDRTEFFLILTSTTDSVFHNADLKNTLLSFENTFGSPLKLQAADWMIALSTLYIHNEFKNSSVLEQKPTYLRILCEEISTIGTQELCLGIVGRKPTSLKAKSIFYEPKNREYFPLSSFMISKLHIKIKVGNSVKPDIPGIKLFSGQPTTIILHFKRRMMAIPQQIIRVESHPRGNDILENNTCQKFSCQLGSALKFDPLAQVDYEIAVSSITYVPNFPLGANVPFRSKIYNSKGVLKKLVTHRTPFSGTNLNDFKIYINDILSKFDKSIRGIEIRIDVVADTGKIMIVSSKNCELCLPSDLLYNMGLRDFEKQPNRIKYVNDEMRLIIQAGIQWNMDTFPDYAAFIPEIGFIYSDFVKTSIVGEQEVPILKSFPIHRNPADRNIYITHSVSVLEFYPLNRFDLSYVSFSVRDITGGLIPFVDKNANFIITMIMRAKKTIWNM